MHPTPQPHALACTPAIEQRRASNSAHALRDSDERPAAHAAGRRRTRDEDAPGRVSGSQADQLAVLPLHAVADLQVVDAHEVELAEAAVVEAHADVEHLV